MEDCSPKPKADRRYGSKIDPYAHLVDEWLEADRLLPRKQRHTIRRVHDRLLAETDYDGEYSTTMRYVHRWREANRGVPDREGYVRLEWAAGSMQVDFGVARARIVYGQINVYGVTTKSERHKRSYWTRTADGNGIGGRKAPVPYGS